MAIMTRTLGLVFVLLVGSGSLVYGLFFHRIAVEETKLHEVSVGFSTLSDVEQSSPESHGEVEAAPPEKSPESNNGSTADDVDPFRTPSAEETPARNAENPFESPPDASGAFGIRYENVTEPYVDVHEESEWMIVREVTVGGVTLLTDGHLKRTYSGKPPSLCPT
jgi:hypothetical protein